MSFPATLFGAEKDVYETGTFQQYPIGQKLVTPDGSIFRYVEMGATLGVANNLYQAEVPTTNWVKQDLATTAMAVGDSTITFTPGATAIAADELAGGTILVESAADLGHIYRIKSNTVSAGSAACILTLENGVTVKVAVATGATHDLTALKNPWKDIIIHPSPATSIVVGIPRVVIAANAYGWVCTRGPASCLINGVPVINEPVVPSNAVDGSVGAKRKSGTGTIANAETTEVVTHNLGSTPTLDNINFVFGEDSTTAISAWWVDTLTATQFTININDPGASGQDLAWTVEVNYEPVGVALRVPSSADFGVIFLTLE